MEPAVSPAGDERKRKISMDYMERPQWSPPFHRRVTRRANLRRSRPVLAAMEPAVSPAGDATRSTTPQDRI